jgi:hypothetical protein
MSTPAEVMRNGCVELPVSPILCCFLQGLCCVYLYNKSPWFNLAMRIVTRSSLLLCIVTFEYRPSNVAANFGVCINHWTLRALDQKHLKCFEMWCWRRMEKISWTDHLRN